MTLSEKLKAARSKAEAQAISEALKAQQARLRKLQAFLETSQTLDLVVGKLDKDYLVVLPMDAGSCTEFEQALADGVKKALRGCRPQETGYAGLLAYRLPNRRAVRLRTRSISAEGLEFKIDATNIGEFHPSSPEARPNQDQRRAYRPTLERGETVEITLSSNSAITYKLFPLAKGIRAKFPGYRVPFTIRDGDLQLTTYVTGVKDGTPGELAGTYCAKGLRPFFAAHPGLRVGSKVTVKAVEPGSVYDVVKVHK